MEGTSLTVAEAPPPLMPPEHREAEEHVLGAILLDHRRAIEAVRSIVSPEHFADTHATLYRVCLTLHDRGDPVDGITVSAELERLGTLDRIGGQARIAELVALTPAVSNVAHHAHIVRDYANRRRQLQIANDLARTAHNGGLRSHPEVALDLRNLLDGGHAHTLTPLNLDELLAGDIPETRWVWNGWLAWDDIALLVGDPGVGKSLLALGLANAARIGGTFLDEPVDQATVGIFDLENPLSEVHKRLRRVGMDATDHQGLHYFHAPNIDLMTPEGISRFRATVDHYGLQLVILDSFRRIAPGVDENDSAAISAFFQPLRHLTQNRQIAIVVIHHARKRTGSDQDASAGQMTRGSGDFLGAVDTQIYARKRDSGTFTIEHGKSRRGLEHEKVVVKVSPAENDTLEFTNEGASIDADNRLNELMVKAIEAVKETGPMTTTELRLRLGIKDAGKRTFYSALKLAVARDYLVRREAANRKNPDTYLLGSRQAGGETD